MSAGSDEMNEQQAALTGAFYRASAEEQREHLQLKDEERAAREAIAAATGITDAAFLAELAGLGIRVDSLAALTLIPLIAVAWSDRDLDQRERTAVLNSAVATGIERGSTSYRLLEIWMLEEPPPDLINTWQHFIAALCQQMSGEEITRMESVLLGRARQVAAAAGDAMQRTPHISAAEESCMERLAQAFR
jgi:hypothetical protein